MILILGYYTFFVFLKLLMRRSHISEYGSRLRSDSGTTRKAKRSDYYAQWSGMSYHRLEAVVYVSPTARGWSYHNVTAILA